MAARRFSQFEYSGLGYGMIWVCIITLLALGMLAIPVNIWNAYLFAAALVVGAMVLFTVYHAISKLMQSRRRSSILTDYALTHHYSFGATDQREYIDSLGVIAETAASYSNFELENMLKTDDWSYADFAYLRRGNPYYGSPVLWKASYGVISIVLPRKLPNIFFDSKRVFGNQFKRHISDKQIGSFEGDFDKFFRTYIPENYTIDSLSFITPEVMIAIRDASDYDIEIFENHVFLYGPQIMQVEQLEDMRKKAASIKQALMNNILTYRDERLPVKLGRLTVARKGQLLKRSVFWDFVWLTIVAIIILCYVIAAIQTVVGWIIHHLS